MRRRSVLGLIAGCTAGVVAPGAMASRAWKLIADTETRRVHLMRGRHEVWRIEPMACGRGGTARLRTLGSQKTPLGRYRLGWHNPASQYEFFIGLNYPLPEHARLGLQHGIIDRSEYEAILHAHARSERPPQDTPLGGYIGIHGLGTKPPEGHALINWTEGCLAVPNGAILALADELPLGTEVLVI